MDRLRPRSRPREPFSGFTKSEIEKLEKLLEESGSETTTKAFCRKIATRFNCSSGRAGKPPVRWTEVQNWFSDKREDRDRKLASSHDLPQDLPIFSNNLPLNKALGDSEIPEGQKIPDLSQLEFEAKSSKDGAWYDVDMFLAHRFLSSGEAEVLVRFIGFGADEDEWINVKKAVRERSIPLEHWECHKLKVGDFVLCFQVTIDEMALFPNFTLLFFKNIPGHLQAKSCWTEAYFYFINLLYLGNKYIMFSKFSLTLGKERSGDLLRCSYRRNTEENARHKGLQVSLLDSLRSRQLRGEGSVEEIVPQTFMVDFMGCAVLAWITDAHGNY